MKAVKRGAGLENVANWIFYLWNDYFLCIQERLFARTHNWTLFQFITVSTVTTTLAALSLAVANAVVCIIESNAQLNSIHIHVIIVAFQPNNKICKVWLCNSHKELLVHLFAVVLFVLAFPVILPTQHNWSKSQREKETNTQNSIEKQLHLFSPFRALHETENDFTSFIFWSSFCSLALTHYTKFDYFRQAKLTSSVTMCDRL